MRSPDSRRRWTTRFHRYLANPIARRTATGTAHLLDDDDVDQRLATLPAYNSSLVRRLGTDLLTVRVDLDPA